MSIAHEVWRECYAGGWQAGDITPESFSHPAKAAKGLIYRIVRTGLERGWWSKNDTLVDPFGGVGTTGLACAAHGIAAFSVELEPRFVEMAQANIDLHRVAWERMGLPVPLIVQGDSRQLASIVRESVGGGVTSPPYATSDQDYARGWSTIDREKSSHQQATLRQSEASYGDTPGQIANLPAGAITSPPYANRVDDSGTGPVAEKNGHYGQSDGQVGNLRLSGVTSPPYEELRTDGGKLAKDGIGGIRPYSDDPVDAWRTTRDQDNLGNVAPETYWDAVATIYQQMHDLFPAGGTLACIVKSFVRNKAIVDLPQMTLDLLLSQGWEPVVWVDAMLTGEGVQDSMLAEVPQHQKARKSFFRRLAESKGSPRIDAEVVLVVRKITTPML